MRTPVFVIVGCLGITPLYAQISLQNTAATSLRSLLSLQAGPKLMDQSNGGATITIYNLDLSVYRVLNLPTGYSAGPWYVTEELFDTDPTTIEFMMSVSTQDPFEYALKVIREDGSVLFSKEPGMISSSADASTLDIRPAIFETANGAVMLVQEMFGSPTEIYSLPGHVPCVDACHASAYVAASVGVEVQAGSGNGEVTVLNQGSADALVQYRLPPGTTSGMLRIVDAEGKLVRSETVRGQGTLRVGTSAFGAGVYQVSIQPDHGAPFGTRLMIVR